MHVRNSYLKGRYLRICLLNKSMTRYFKLQYNNETIGRYTGKTPKQAANKAFTGLKKNVQGSGHDMKYDYQYNFTIR